MLRLMLMLVTPVADSPPDLAWLEGEWCTVAVNGRQTCELWGPARGGMMLGTSQTVRDGKTRDFEYMRIELSAEAVVFYGSPRGSPAVAFRESKREAQGITFGNPGHDYPQRIRYWREGEMLNAEIALADGSRPMRWAYTRVP
ncbi:MULTISPECIES: DUF6265 family protein [unclassified Sphingomonas]|uniref:DUF6265 family protein n=1 Tax=unclassified Sphingomonas TaxID=196159 RepID=UPI002151A50E|nr:MULTISPECIES: DUF6265 family protein [unclassified Sphingomonas]MCR5869745.1 DUF6265 family protein [Sphingomonas sp. J344]UUX98551.1 DUF6265 family protein [Sphingomonas sp. J315]